VPETAPFPPHAGRQLYSGDDPPQKRRLSRNGELVLVRPSENDWWDRLIQEGSVVEAAVPDSSHGHQVDEPDDYPLVGCVLPRGGPFDCCERGRLLNKYMTALREVENELFRAAGQERWRQSDEGASGDRGGRTASLERLAVEAALRLPGASECDYGNFLEHLAKVRRIEIGGRLLESVDDDPRGGGFRVTLHDGTSRDLDERAIRRAWENVRNRCSFGP
jgi:hypothetical protein